MTSSSFSAIPADRYSVEQLTDMYNESRVDYIVPMPMNARRLSEYIQHYDVDLSGSVVAVNAEQQVAGLGMLGVRGERAWITRLGVIPTRRGRGIGQFLMEHLLQNAVNRACTLAQLEVIAGNAPAQNLFQKLGFWERRRLLVIRRAPGTITPPDYEYALDVIAPSLIPRLLDQRDDEPSWLDETISLVNAGSLQGLRVTLEDGESGWIVSRLSAFQLSHFIMKSDTGTLSLECAYALLTAVHQRNPRHDTKIENIPETCPWLEAYNAAGYTVEFERVEMVKAL
ncbi:MAG: GNAT family N-acetyltransferase [bacterium]|nr:GNAT family N-acetyltransferase [bacterium]